MDMFSYRHLVDNWFVICSWEKKSQTMLGHNVKYKIKQRPRTLSQPFQRTFANSYSLLISAYISFLTEVPLSSVATAIPHNKRGEEIDLLSHPFFLQINGSQSLFHYNACSLSSTLAETYINHGHWTGINEGNWIQWSSTCPLTGFFWLLSHVIYLKLTKVLYECLFS